MAIQKVNFSIDGLSCKTCATHIANVLSLIRGVTHATVDPSSLECRSFYNDDHVSEKKLIREISSLGYRVLEN